MMSSGAAWRGVLAAGIVAAGAVLGWEFVGSEAQDAALPVAANSAPAQAGRTKAAPVSSGGSAKDVASVLARPLFSPSRQPDDSGPSSAHDTVTRLTGVILSPAGNFAIFAGDGAGRPIVVGDGGRIGSSVVHSIDANGVVITGAGGEKILRPQLQPASERPASPAEKKPPPSAQPQREVVR